MGEFKTVSRSFRFFAKLEIDIKDIEKKYGTVNGYTHLVDRIDFIVEFSIGSQINGYLHFVHKNSYYCSDRVKGVYIIFHVNGDDKGKVFFKSQFFSSNFKVWEFENFLIIQILREINFEASKSAKTAVFVILEAANFVHLVNFSQKKCKK